VKIQAEASLYPLRTDTVGMPIRDFLVSLEDAGLVVQQGNMSSTLAGDVDEVFAALSRAFQRAANRFHVVLILKVSNACPLDNGSNTGSMNDGKPM
jgi:uncharacterized protein YqgV (UPF0045/DUF77 family)